MNTPNPNRTLACLESIMRLLNTVGSYTPFTYHLSIKGTRTVYKVYSRTTSISVDCWNGEWLQSSFMLHENLFTSPRCVIGVDMFSVATIPDNGSRFIELSDQGEHNLERVELSYDITLSEEQHFQLSTAYDIPDYEYFLDYQKIFRYIEDHTKFLKDKFYFQSMTYPDREFDPKYFDIISNDIEKNYLTLLQRTEKVFDPEQGVIV